MSVTVTNIERTSPVNSESPKSDSTSSENVLPNHISPTLTHDNGKEEDEEEHSLEIKEWVVSNSCFSPTFRVNFDTEWIDLNNEEVITFPCIFKPLTGKYTITTNASMKFYKFRMNGEHTLCVALVTIWYIFKQGFAPNVELSIIPEDESETQYRHLVQMLTESSIEHNYDEMYLTIYKCRWNDLLKIAHFKTSYDLAISGGGSGGKLCKLNVEKYSSHDNCYTTAYQKSIRKHIQDRSTDDLDFFTIGVIDSGCRSPSNISQFKSLNFNSTMFDATSKPAQYCDYFDRYEEKEENDVHGTAVIEILSKCLRPGFKVFVANIISSTGEIAARSVIKTFKDLRLQNVKLVNCSFSGCWSNRKLWNELNLVQQSGIIVVASAGNWSSDIMSTDLNNGESIMVGSHNQSDVISSFSSGKCHADICGFGEEVNSDLLEVKIQNGTSFATAHVTAVIGNYMAATPPLSEARSRKNILFRLLGSADMLVCPCHFHKQEKKSLK